MANNDTTVIGCTRCHVCAAVASGLCAECVESLQDENRRLRAFVEEVVAINPYADVTDSANRLIDVCRTAAALLAGMEPTEE